MEKVNRLSVEDFKLKKLENKSEVEKLLGGVASGCHIMYSHPPDNSSINLIDADDCYEA